MYETHRQANVCDTSGLTKYMRIPIPAWLRKVLKFELIISLVASKKKSHADIRA